MWTRQNPFPHIPGIQKVWIDGEMIYDRGLPEFPWDQRLEWFLWRLMAWLRF